MSNVRAWRAVTAKFTSGILVLSTLFTIGAAVVATPAAALATCAIGSAAQNSLTVEPSQPTVMYIDSGVTPRIDASYVGYRITNNTGGTISGYWTSLTNFTGNVVNLANTLDQYIQIPDLTNGSSTTIYFLLKATGATKVSQSHDFKIFTKKPDASSAVNKYGCTFSFSEVAETIKASANKPDAPTVGTIGDIGTTFTVTATGATGTIGSGSPTVGRILWFTPTSYSTFPTRTFRLESVVLKVADNNSISTSGSNKVWTYKERLFVKTDTVPDTGVLSGSQATADTLVGKRYYENIYTFRVISAGTGTIAPQAQISSGTQIKHTGTTVTATVNGTSAKLLAYIEKTVDTPTANLGSLPKTTIGGTTYNEVPYKIRIWDTASVSIRVDQVVDEPAIGAIYKSGSAKIKIGSGSVTALANPETLTSESSMNPMPLHFYGPFDIPGTGTKEINIYYTMYVPAVKGTYSNHATAYIGDSQITINGAVALPGVDIKVNETGTVTTYETVTASLDPVAVTTAVTNLDTKTATINGTIDPNNDTSTTGVFEWGTSSTLASSTTISLGSVTGASPVNQSSVLTGLSTNTTYYYRIVAISKGVRYEGVIMSFTTLIPKSPPTVTTDVPTNVSSTDATLNSSISANLNSVYLEYKVWRTNDTETVRVVDDPSTPYASGGATPNPYTVFSGAFSSTFAINMSDGAYVGGASSGLDYLSATANATVYYYVQLIDTTSLAIVATGVTRSFKLTTYLNQTITFDTITDITYGDAAPTINPTASSGMTVTRSSNSQDVCTIDGSGNIVISKIGLCSISANQSGGLKSGTTDYYNAATEVTRTFNIRPKPITVTAVAKTKVYGDADPALTFTSSTTLVGSDTFTGTISRDAGANVGTYTINQNTLALTDNYTLTYNSANFTITKRPITITVADKSKVYGASDPALTYSLTSGSIASGDALATVVTGSLTRAAGSNVGTYAIETGTVVATSNYQLTIIPGTFTITVKPITVKADSKSRKQSDPDPALTYSITVGGLVGSDTFTGTITRAPGTAVGTYAITQGTLALSPTASNYTLTFINDTFTITDKTIPVLVWSDPAAITYGETLTTTQLNAIVHISNSDPTVLTASCVYDPALGTLLTPGTHSLAVTCTPTDSVNYSSISGSVHIVVNPRPITVTADPQSKQYGASDPGTFTYAITVGSLVGSDVLSGSLTRNAGETVGSWTITQGTLANTYYTITYNSNSLSITTRPIAVTADAKSKMYGENDPALTYTYTGTLVGSDDFTGSISRASGNSVGTYLIGKNTLALNSNYTLTYNSANFTITTRPITVTADNKSKDYGDSDPSFTYALTSGTFASGDSIGSIVSGALTRTSGSNVGSYSITIGSLVASSNYAMTFNNGTLTINAKAIVVTADDKTKKTTDADPTFTYTINSGSLVSPDAFSGSLTRANLGTDTVGDYAITQGTLALSSNYSLTFHNGTLTITNKIIPVLVWNNPAPITYGETLTATQLNAWVKKSNVDSTTVTATCVYDPAAGTLLSAGSHTLSVTCTPSDGVTYSNVSGTVTITVNPLALTFTVTADDKQYDGGTTATIHTGSLTGILSRDSGNVVFDSSKVTGAFATKTVGATKTVNLTLGTPLLSGSAKDNYTVTTPSDPTAAITKAPVNVTANDLTVAAGDPLPSVTYTVAALLGSDTGDPFTGITCSSNYSTSDSAGASRYTQCSGGTATNYTPAHIDGVVTITSAAVKYSITYAAGGGSGTLPTQGDLSSGQSFTVGSGSGLSRSGYTFSGWSCNSTSKAAGSTYTVGSSNVTCTAQWSAVSSGGSGGGGNSNSNSAPTTNSNSQPKKVGQVKLVTVATTAVKEVVTIVSATPSPSPTPSATRTATPSPSPTPSATRTATPTPSPTPSATRTATPTPSPSASPSASSSPNPSSTRAATPSPSPASSNAASPSPSSSSTDPTPNTYNGVELSQTTTIPTSGIKSITYSGVGIAKVALKDNEVSVQAKTGFSGYTTVKITVTNENEEVEKITAEVLVLPEPALTPKVKVTENETSRISWKRSINATGYEVRQGDEVLCTSKITMCTFKKVITNDPPVTIIALGRDKTQSIPTTATYEAPVRATGTPDIALVINFDTNKYNLDELDRLLIRQFADDVVKYKYTEVDITGHTDSRGGVDNNVLSLNRAKAAADYLLKLVPNLKVTVGGYASTVNVADNASVDGLAANRRAEFRVVEKLVTMTKQVPYSPTA